MTYAEDTVGGVPGIWCYPNGADASKVLLYTHGGGFAVGSASSHRELAAHVAKALGVHAFVLDYRLAPEHPHPAGPEDAVSAFLALTESGFAPANITTIGDSAGGNLAVVIPPALKEQGKPLPGSVIAFSPWLDMENKGETLVTNDATDALTSVGLLEGMIAGVLGDQTSPTAPLANPLYADYSGFPRSTSPQVVPRVAARQRHPAQGPGHGCRGRRDPFRRRGPAARLPVQRRPHRRRGRPDRRHRQVVRRLSEPSTADLST